MPFKINLCPSLLNHANYPGESRIRLLAAVKLMSKPRLLLDVFRIIPLLLTRIFFGFTDSLAGSYPCDESDISCFCELFVTRLT